MKNPLIIGKLEAAKRQLETAIDLYFNYKDPVSIHTLCAAAYNIVHDVNTQRGGDPMVKDLWRLLDTRQAKEFKQHINRVDNFLKHADKDPDGLCTLNQEWTEALLLEATQRYMLLTGEQSPRMVLFLVWFMVRHPKVFEAKPPLDLVLKRLDMTVFSDDRQQFLAEFWSLAVQSAGT